MSKESLDCDWLLFDTLTKLFKVNGFGRSKPHDTDKANDDDMFTRVVVALFVVITKDTQILSDPSSSPASFSSLMMSNPPINSPLT